MLGRARFDYECDDKGSVDRILRKREERFQREWRDKGEEDANDLIRDFSYDDFLKIEEALNVRDATRGWIKSLPQIAKDQLDAVREENSIAFRIYTDAWCAVVQGEWKFFKTKSAMMVKMVSLHNKLRMDSADRNVDILR